MNKSRLEAFSDGVLAIIITIMVLDIKVPGQSDWDGLMHLLPTLTSYVLSFALVGVYWNNHHHLLNSLKKISSNIMWSNLNLLFWLSLIPFGTKWMGETHFNKFTLILYAILLVICGLSYSLLQNQIVISLKGTKSDLPAIIKKQNFKVLISGAAALLAIPAAYVDTKISLALFATSSIIWIIPSKAIENELSKKDKNDTDTKETRAI
ncbi:TMEM175 family protein [Dyadobacter sp. 3J3]|uniref:TMEM175 family protein n=1 Tax=Dyadobacter sp. 3J3 TaxID=2606600 RepID=UPI00135B1B43|nr:TMEM175 family protein [Dyadobacter sp. 3J3]